MPSGLKRFRKAESLHFTNRLIETDYPDGSKKTVDLYHRPKRRSCLTGRLHSCFHGWLHRSRLRGLAPPACTNLPSIKRDSNVRKISYVILRTALARIADQPISQIEQLLPWNLAAAPELASKTH